MVCDGHVTLLGSIYITLRHIHQLKFCRTSRIEEVNEIVNKFPSAQLILAGHVNQLLNTEIIVHTGLTLIVGYMSLHRGDNKLDKMYSLDPCYDSVKIVRSVIKSDHKAIVAYTGASKVAYKKTSTKVKYRKKSPTQHSLFLSYTSTKNTVPKQVVDVQVAYDDFYVTSLGLLDKFLLPPWGYSTSSMLPPWGYSTSSILKIEPVEQ